MLLRGTDVLHAMMVAEKATADDGQTEKGTATNDTFQTSDAADMISAPTQ